jgi:reactive intermediate/imine deaminase
MKSFGVLLPFIAASSVWVLSTSSAYSLDKSVVYTNRAPAPIGPYSQAIKIDNIVYISGQIPIDPKTGELVSGDFGKQSKQVIQNLSEVAKAAGGNLDDFVKVTVYVTDLANFAVFNQVMANYFNKPYPARVVIEVKSLPKQATIEIEALMKVDKKS